MGHARTDLEDLYELHNMLADRVAAGHYSARLPLKVIAEMIVERERRIADELLSSGDVAGVMTRGSAEGE
jgi:hypothetical protein